MKLNWIDDRKWTWLIAGIMFVPQYSICHCQSCVLHDLMSLRPSAGAVLEQIASTLSLFLNYSWPWQAMEFCIDKYYVSGILGRAGDLETHRPWHVCILIKPVWPQNALSMFMCVHVLIRAVCSQCALVFSVLCLNNRSDVIQGQIRGKKKLFGWEENTNRYRLKSPLSRDMAWWVLQMS